MFTADWVVDALCRTEGHPDMWHPEHGTGRVDAARAKQICRRCPVQQHCLDAALARNERDGVWGGVHFGQTRASVRDEMRVMRGIEVDSGFVHGTESGARRHERDGEKPCAACRNAASAAWRRRKAERKEQK